MGIVWKNIQLHTGVLLGRLEQQGKVRPQELPVEMKRQRRFRGHPEEKWPRRREARPAADWQTETEDNQGLQVSQWHW